MASSCHYSGVVLQHKVGAGNLEGKADEASGAAMQREETGDPAWGSPLLSRLRSHGQAQRVRSCWRSKRRMGGECAAIETGGGGRSQREGVMDNVKCHI